MQSLFRKGFIQHTPAGTGNGDSATTTQTQIQLNKDYFTEKYLVHIVTSQASSVAPTGFTPQNCISSIMLEFSGGKRGGNGPRIYIKGKALYEVMRFFKNTPAPLTTFATPTSSADWMFYVDMAMAESMIDWMTGVYTAEYSQIKMTINWNTTTTGIFTGGTVSGAVFHVVDVTAYNTPVVDRSKGSNAVWLATSQHRVYNLTKNPTGAGSGDDVQLQTGRKVRYIQINAYNNSGALSDSIVDQLNILFGGYNYQTTWNKLKNANLADRNYSSVGTVFLDYADDPKGWLDLSQLNEARLKWTSLAAGTVEFTVGDVAGLHA